MAPTTNYGFPVPEQTTSPPDVVKWLGDLATAADTALKGVDNAKLGKTGGTVTGTLYVVEVVKQGAFHLGGQGQLEVYAPGAVPALTTIAHKDASYGNQSMTLAQKYAPSSRAVKTGVEPLQGSGGIVDSLAPVSFRYLDSEAVPEQDRGSQHYGLIAEDVEAAGVPIARDAAGTVLGLRLDDLVAVLLAEVQSLRARVAVLEARP